MANLFGELRFGHCTPQTLRFGKLAGSLQTQASQFASINHQTQREVTTKVPLNNTVFSIFVLLVNFGLSAAGLEESINLLGLSTHSGYLF